VKTYPGLHHTHMRLFWFLFFVLLSTGSFAQALRCTFTDIQTKDSVANVRCWLVVKGDTLSYALSQRNGSLTFDLKGINVAPKEANIVFTHPFYQEGKFVVPYFEPNDTIRKTIQLRAERIQEEKEVVLRPNKPDTVYASTTYSVADFELDAKGALLLLTYEKNLQKDAQLQVVKDQYTAAILSIPERAQSLKRDFRGNIHVLTAESVFGVEAVDSNYALVNIPKDYFFKYLVPIVDSSQTRMFYSSYSDIYPAFEYGSVDQLDATYRTLVEIKDDLMMELYRSEYKWVDVRTKLWAKNLENQTGLDAEIYVGARYFTQSLYYEPVYAPLFLVQDTIYIFDYPKDLLRVYLTDGTPVRTVPIFHHYQAKQSGFQKNLQQDRQTGKIYAVFEQQGYCYVGLLDLQTGVVTQKVKLAFRYVEKVRVHNNEVYFIYRPFESTQKKFLYKQKLPVRTTVPIKVN
jgi:hypothetical protein